MGQDEPAKAPTIKDVAREAGVSFKTVSRVINRNQSVNPALRQAVEAAMQKLSYRPHQAARVLRGRRSYSLALLTGWEDEPAGAFGPDSDEGLHFSDFYSELTIGCGVACRRSDYHLICEFLSYGNRQAAERKLAGLLDNLRPDGLLIPPPLCDVHWLLESLDSRRVRYARLLPGTRLDHREHGPAVVIDDFQAARMITELLLNAGHRRLGMIAGPPHHIAATQRRVGFEAAIAAKPQAQSLVTVGDLTMPAGREKALELLRRPLAPTAIFAANDMMAAGVFAAAAQLGLKIPGDLSVVGFDDSMVARLVNPPLTTVRQPIFDMAVRAADLLIKAADAGAMPEPEIVTLEYSISQRATIAPPRAP